MQRADPGWSAGQISLRLIGTPLCMLTVQTCAQLTSVIRARRPCRYTTDDGDAQIERRSMPGDAN